MSESSITANSLLLYSGRRLCDGGGLETFFSLFIFLMVSSSLSHTINFPQR